VETGQGVGTPLPDRDHVDPGQLQSSVQAMRLLPTADPEENGCPASRSLTVTFGFRTWIGTSMTRSALRATSDRHPIRSEDSDNPVLVVVEDQQFR
jgi:hypothetical protein